MEKTVVTNLMFKYLDCAKLLLSEPWPDNFSDILCDVIENTQLVADEWKSIQLKSNSDKATMGRMSALSMSHTVSRESEIKPEIESTRSSSSMALRPFNRRNRNESSSMVLRSFKGRKRNESRSSSSTILESFKQKKRTPRVIIKPLDKNVIELIKDGIKLEKQSSHNKEITLRCDRKYSSVQPQASRSMTELGESNFNRMDLDNYDEEVSTILGTFKEEKRTPRPIIEPPDKNVIELLNNGMKLQEQSANKEKSIRCGRKCSSVLPQASRSMTELDENNPNEMDLDTNEREKKGSKAKYSSCLSDGCSIS